MSEIAGVTLQQIMGFSIQSRTWPLSLSRHITRRRCVFDMPPGGFITQKTDGPVKDATPTWPSHLPTPPYVKAQPVTNGSLSPAAQPFVGPPGSLPQLNQQTTGESSEKLSGTGDLEVLLPASAMPAIKSANGIQSEASTDVDPKQPPPGQEFGGPAMMPMLPGLDPNGVYYANGFAPAQYFYDFSAGESSYTSTSGDHNYIEDNSAHLPFRLSIFGWLYTLLCCRHTHACRD